MTEESAVFAVSDDRVAWSRSGDQLIVLDLRTSDYLSFNGSAGVLWERLVEGGAAVEDLAAALQAAFGIVTEVAVADAQEFADELLARGYLDRTAP